MSAEVDHPDEGRPRLVRDESVEPAEMRWACSWCQPFSPLVAMPSTKYFWPSRKMIAIGMTEIVRPANSSA